VFSHQLARSLFFPEFLDVKDQIDKVRKPKDFLGFLLREDLEPLLHSIITQ
jgi:hypothetical protein